MIIVSVDAAAAAAAVVERYTYVRPDGSRRIFSDPFLYGGGNKLVDWLDGDMPQCPSGSRARRFRRASPLVLRTERGTPATYRGRTSSRFCFPRDEAAGSCSLQMGKLHPKERRKSRAGDVPCFCKSELQAWQPHILRNVGRKGVRRLYDSNDFRDVNTRVVL
jgi:hypothetical protein